MSLSLHCVNTQRATWKISFFFWSYILVLNNWAWGDCLAWHCTQHLSKCHLILEKGGTSKVRCAWGGRTLPNSVFFFLNSEDRKDRHVWARMKLLLNNAWPNWLLAHYCCQMSAESTVTCLNSFILLLVFCMHRQIITCLNMMWENLDGCFNVNVWFKGYRE